jgi:DNA-binding GntR family transcriptional regulator
MSKEIIDAIASGDNLGAESQFKSVIQQKVGDALEKRREEVANTMVTQHIPEVEENEEEVPAT